MSLTVKRVGKAELGDCPAASALDTETGNMGIFTNRDVFVHLPKEQQRFILAHELGHLLLNSSDETVADSFALGLTAGRQRESLKSAMRALHSMKVIPYARMLALYNLCLAVDKNHQ